MNTPLAPGQNAVVTLVGNDAGTPPNPAPLTNIAFTVDDHTLVYAAQADRINSPQLVTVVARGPLGVANVTFTASDVNGNPLPPVTEQFTVVAGLAVSLSATVGAPTANTGSTPGLPVGW